MEINKIYQGNALTVLKTSPDEIVDTIITSPPYWGLRDYGDETKVVWRGDSRCEHEWGEWVEKHDVREETISGKTRTTDRCYGDESRKFNGNHQKHTAGSFCTKCNAWHGQLGLEPSLNLYLDHLLQITAELKRVLKSSGVMFWVHGDSYAGSGGPGGDYNEGGLREGQPKAHKREWTDPKLPARKRGREMVNQNNFPAKCMVNQNHRLVIRMVDEQGWILRNIIIWHKSNHMPSSAQDRFTNSYETVFMFTKNRSYWFDLDAVRVPHKDVSVARALRGVSDNHKYSDLPNYAGGGGINKPRPNTRKGMNVSGQSPQGIHRKRHSGYYGADGEFLVNPSGKNPGDVWTIATQPFPKAHFAKFPEKLIEPMILSSCPEEICKECNEARVRMVKREVVEYKATPYTANSDFIHHGTCKSTLNNSDVVRETVGWTDCNCNKGWKSGIVLDPFMGAGTTALVALKNNRRFIGIELNPKFVKMAYEEIDPYLHQKKIGDYPGR